MIRNEQNPSSAGTGESPVFELEYLVDDQVEPTEVTIFSPDPDEVTTHWISINIESAVPLESIQ